MKLRHILTKSLVLVGISSLLLVGCTSKKVEIEATPTATPIIVEQKDLPIATIKIKDMGEMTAELYPQYAPNTVNNFIELANSGFYDGLTFHRVIEDFMIQGGDPEGTGAGGPGYTIKGEFVLNGVKENTLSHEEGVLSMARKKQPLDSAGSQFFIVSGKATSLDSQYAGFGKVITGFEIVEAIEKVKTDTDDKPITPVIIESIRVDTKGITYPSPQKH